MGNSPSAPPPTANPAHAKPAPPPPPSAFDKAVLEVKVTRDKLQKQKKKILADCDRLTGDAKALLKAGKKDRATIVVKMRRNREAELLNVEGQIANLDSLVNDLQRTEMQAKVLESLKQGNDALKSLQALMPLEEVERLMEDNAEALAYSDELSQMLAGMSAEDEQRAEADLEAMMREMELGTLPEAPTHVPVVEPKEATPPAAVKEARQPVFA